MTEDIYLDSQKLAGSFLDRGGAALARAEEQKRLALDLAIAFGERIIECTDLPEKVIFSGPATIAIFPDGSKSIAKCSDNDAYDKEKGLLMCMAKRVWGSKTVDVLEEWCGE